MLRVGMLYALLFFFNIGFLGVVYIDSSQDGTEEAGRISRLIASYAEPQNDPRAIVRVETRCRYWGPNFCKEAEAIRKGERLGLFSPPAVPDAVRTHPGFEKYTDARHRLHALTEGYLDFLDTQPLNRMYVERSQKYEEAANREIGNILTSLRVIQSEYLLSRTLSWVKILILVLVNLILLSVLFLLHSPWRGADR